MEFRRFSGALNASKNAKLWAWIAFASGILILVSLTILSVLGVLAGIGMSGF